MIKTVKRELTECGYPLDLGNKDFEKIKKVALLSETVEPSHSRPTTNDAEDLPLSMDDLLLILKLTLVVPNGVDNLSDQHLPPGAVTFVGGLIGGNTARKSASRMRR